MTQKEREVASKYGIMKSQNTINQERSTSHEYDNTRSKKKASSSKICGEKRKKPGKPNIRSKPVKRKTVVQKIRRNMAVVIRKIAQTS